LLNLISERGAQCEICGGLHKLGLFHILPKGKYPRLRFYKENLLIAGWFCCHFVWHHSYYEARDRIEPRLKEILGDNYEEKLKILDGTAQKLTYDRLLEILKEVENG
jgi:hypothetical protein